MDDDLVSVADVAKQFDIRKNSAFRIIDRLGIEKKMIREPSKKNQEVAYIKTSELDRVAEECARTARKTSIEEGSRAESGFSVDQGVFYLIQLEPEHDPGRFKVGFTANMPERLRSHRCSAPFAKVLKTWPCRSRWEQTAIDCATADCDQIHTEVFRTDSLDRVIERCDTFFSLMPNLDSVPSEAKKPPAATEQAEDF